MKGSGLGIAICLALKSPGFCHVKSPKILWFSPKLHSSNKTMWPKLRQKPSFQHHLSLPRGFFIGHSTGVQQPGRQMPQGRSSSLFCFLATFRGIDWNLRGVNALAENVDRHFQLKHVTNWLDIWPPVVVVRIDWFLWGISCGGLLSQIWLQYLLGHVWTRNY